MRMNRKHGAAPCTAVTITMSNEDHTHLDAIRERFRDHKRRACPSRSLMLSLLVNAAFKSGFSPVTDRPYTLP